jgi:hypothetical protein
LQSGVRPANRNAIQATVRAFEQHPLRCIWLIHDLIDQGRYELPQRLKVIEDTCDFYLQGMSDKKEVGAG